MAVISEEVRGASADRTVYLLHGILGAGRNWRSFARRWAKRRPELRILLVDQRHHGEAPPASPPDTVAACADDLRQLEAVHGAADHVVGHSFGGKVALAWAAERHQPAWALDSPPGKPPSKPTADSNDVLHIVRTLHQAPVPAADRQLLRDHLAAAGISEPLLNWLLTSATRQADGWRWVWDLDGVDRLMQSYFSSDLWDAAESEACQLVHAGRSDRWSAADLQRGQRSAALGAIGWHELPDAGHWLHVDDPEGLMIILDAM